MSSGGLNHFPHTIRGPTSARSRLRGRGAAPPHRKASELRERRGVQAAATMTAPRLDHSSTLDQFWARCRTQRRQCQPPARSSQCQSRSITSAGATGFVKHALFAGGPAAAGARCDLPASGAPPSVALAFALALALGAGAGAAPAGGQSQTTA